MSKMYVKMTTKCNSIMHPKITLSANSYPKYTLIPIGPIGVKWKADDLGESR